MNELPAENRPAADQRAVTLDVRRAREAFDRHDREHMGIGGLHSEPCDEWIAAEYARLQDSPAPDQRAVTLDVLAERRATVERIREAMLRDIDGADWTPAVEQVVAILDEVAAR